MTLAIISHPSCLLHEMGPYHPEQPARLLAIEEELRSQGLYQQFKPYLAAKAPKEALLRVHTAAHVENIFSSSPEQGLVMIDPDTAMNPFTLDAALYAAGSGLLAVDLLMKNEVQQAFCNIRPPGHHAEIDQAMGFCFFNNIAVAVAYALEHYGLERVAIIDFDVHHGNGTEAIFKNEERVLLCSSFQSPFYPDTEAEDSPGHLLPIPLSANSGSEAFRAAVKAKWLKAISDFNPQMIFFSAGFDAYTEDELANLNWTEEDYAWITSEMKEIANRCAEGRMISFLEGGYHLKGLGRCAAAHLNALAS